MVWECEEYLQLTPNEKYKVRPIDPKYVAVKGSLGVDIRCCMYVQGPNMKAHDTKNRTDPTDQLMSHEHD